MNFSHVTSQIVSISVWFHNLAETSQTESKQAFLKKWSWFILMLIEEKCLPFE